MTEKASASISPADFIVKITSKVRREVFRAWGDTCAYCRVRPAEHCDHIFPRAKGGLDCLGNYAAACVTCNQMKTDMILGEGILHIIGELARKKAPDIFARLVPPRKSKPDTSSLLDDLGVARANLEFALQDEQSNRFDRATALSRHRASAHADFRDSSPTNIRIAIQRARADLKRLERTRALDPLRDLLIQLRAESGEDIELAREAVESEFGTARRADLDKAIALQKRRNKPRPPDVVDLGLPTGFHQMLHDGMEGCEDLEEVQMGTMAILRSDHPNFSTWIDHHRGWPRPAQWRRHKSCASLYHISDIKEREVEVTFRRDARFFLRIGLNLGCSTFEFPSHYDPGIRPDPAECTALHS